MVLSRTACMECLGTAQVGRMAAACLQSTFACWPASVQGRTLCGRAPASAGGVEPGHLPRPGPHSAGRRVRVDADLEQMGLLTLPVLAPVGEVAVRLQLELGDEVAALLVHGPPIRLAIGGYVLIYVAPAAELQAVEVLDLRRPSLCPLHRPARALQGVDVDQRGGSAGRRRAHRGGCRRPPGAHADVSRGARRRRLDSCAAHCQHHGRHRYAAGT
mmetsp:Transcript_112624/g.242691  ORF Transcript_112624/g.242691 Transcript_112624/m.242691 type:complete len:216 (+) Transcript_112624:37-684(+)